MKKKYLGHMFMMLLIFIIGNQLGINVTSQLTQSDDFLASLLNGIDNLFLDLKQFNFKLIPQSNSYIYGILPVFIYGLIIFYHFTDTDIRRSGEEYGSARWGKPKDIAPYIDKAKEFNIPLTDTESLSLSGRMKITAKDNFNRNKNVVVVGGAGSGKTRFFVKPNLMQMHSSYVVSDSKGLLLSETGKMFEEAGYKIKIFDLINRENSHQYNPFKYIRNEDDILKVVNNLIKNTTNKNKQGGDDFWEKAETALLMAIFSYLIDCVNEEDQTLANVLHLVRLADIPEDEPGYVSPLDVMFNELEELVPGHFGVGQYKIFKLSGDKTTKSILVSLGVRLAPFDIPSIQRLVEKDTLQLDTIGDEKTILYILLSDTDTSFNFLASMMYQQLFDSLVWKADNIYKGRLPVHVRCLLDEFANIGQIPDFEKVIAVIRSREISTNVILQNISQLKTLYKDTWETIMGTSDTLLYLGGMEQSTHEYMSKLLGKQTIKQENMSISRGNQGSYSQNFQKVGRALLEPDEVASLKGQECLLKIRGCAPFLSKKYNIEKHKNYKKLGDVADDYWFDRTDFLVDNKPGEITEDTVEELLETELSEDTRDASMMNNNLLINQDKINQEMLNQTIKNYLSQALLDELNECQLNNLIEELSFFLINENEEAKFDEFSEQDLANLLEEKSWNLIRKTENQAKEIEFS